MTVVTADDGGPGLAAALRDASPLLLSVALLMAGNGLTSTLLGVRGGLEGMAPGVVGVVLAGFYLGFIVGSMVAPATIARVGHVRVFAGLASLASGAVLVHVIQPHPVTWFVLRVISGVCISALYVVCETWLNGAATNRSRGGLFAAYMTVVSAALLAGQFLFAVADPGGFAPFVLASVLVSLAVVPVSLASFPAPVAPEPTPVSLRTVFGVAPLGPVGAALSGFIGAAMLGAGVVYAAEAGFGRFATGAFVGAALVGGAVLQIPLGAWSDRVDRRVVIAVSASVAAAFALVGANVATDRRLVLIALVTVAGGATFPLYSLCNAHLNDYLDHALVVGAGARMVLVNGVGAVAGPIVGGAAVGAFGPASLFTVLAAGYLGIALFALYRMTRRSAVPEEERATFQPVVVGVGPIPISYEAEAEELYPPEVHELDVDDRRLTYRVQGRGPTVVFVDDTPGREAWATVEPALALDGLRAVTLHVAPSDLPGDVVTAYYALLRQLDLPWATVVGLGRSTRVVARLADEHADAVEAAVLVNPHTATIPGAVTRPVLVLDRPLPFADPEGTADDITDFVRHLPAPSSASEPA
jgi:MFS family permease